MKSLKKTFFRGLALAVPLAIVLYVFIRVIGIIKKIIDPIAEKLGINDLLGSATITIFAVGLIVLVILLLGLLMRIKSVSNVRQKVEGMILKFIPSLNYLKLMAEDKLGIGDSQNTWKPVLLFHESSYNAAFIVEEDDSMATFFVSKGTSLTEGDIVTAYKKDIEMAPATFDELTKYSRAFGKGFISLINQAKKSGV